MEEALGEYSFELGTKITFGPGTHQRLGSIARELNARKVLFITDPALVRTGLAQKVMDPLKGEGIEVELFDEVSTEPTDEQVHSGAARLKAVKPDLLVALGGGSVMDCAKCIGVIAHNPGRITDYEGASSNFPNDSPLPLVALPTTSGTGAEVAAWAVITDTARNLKMSLGSPFLLPDHALVDPVLTLDLPPKATAYSGFDALSQSIEGMLSRRRSPLTHMIGLRAVKLISENIGAATHRGWDVLARSNMSLGSLLGGINMNLGGCIIVHSIAETLGGTYHLPHGLTVGLILPHMLRFNLIGDIPLYAEIAQAIGEDTTVMTEREAADRLILRIEEMHQELQFPSLAEAGVKRQDFPSIARIAMENPSTADNPRPMTVDDFLFILDMCVP